MSEAGQLTARQQMLSAGAGAMIVNTAMTPFDVVKIRLQRQQRDMADTLQRARTGYSGDTRTRQLHTAPSPQLRGAPHRRLYAGTLDAFVKIARQEGAGSLWSGLSPTLVLAVPRAVCYIPMYERLKRVILGQLEASSSCSAPPSWVPLVAGGAARLVAVTVVSPLELVRTKVQSQQLSWAEVRASLRQLVTSQGVRGLWSGYTATLLRDVPFSALYWPLYEAARQRLTLDSSLAVNFVSGAVAGSVASAVTLPFDVIKTIKQIELGRGEARTNLAITRHLVSTQGPASLFSGLAPRLLKVAPACAVMISSYEFCKEFFGHKNCI